MKKKILFMCDGIALSHFVRTMFLISCLDRNKYEIILAAGPEYKNKAVGKVDQFIELPCLSAEEFERRNNTLTAKHIYDEEVLKNYIESDLKIISNVAPDVIVGDLRVSLGITSRLTKVPYINIQNAHWSTYSLVNFAIPDLTKFKMFLCMLLLVNHTKVQKNFIRGYNQCRKQYDMEKIKSFQEFYTAGDLNLYVDTPLLSPTRELPKGHKYIGPILDFIDCPLPDWWSEIKTNKKIVYCSIGSTGSVNKIMKIAKALEKLDVTVIIATAGKTDKSIFPESFYVAKYLPALQVIEKADLVIYNGGSGTLYQAMSKGKPVLALPTGTDQFMASSQVEKLKLGKILRSHQMKVSNLVKVINELLTDSMYKKNAQKVMAEIKQYNVKEKFTSAFEEGLNKLLIEK